MAGGFFFVNGVILYGVRGNIEEAGNFYLLDIISPFIVLGIALFVVTLMAIFIPIKAPGGPPWRMIRGIGRGMDRNMAWRIALMTVLVFGLIVSIPILDFLFGGGLYVTQRITIVFVAFLVFFGFGAALWAYIVLR